MLSATTRTEVTAAAFTAATELLARAAAEMAEAAAAAQRGEINLAVGTALGAEAATDKARALIDAIKALR